MIELAPGHKQGLPVSNPVWIAGGMVGYGEAAPRGLVMAGLGGVVIGPILASSRAGATLPRVAETAGGMVLETGWQNRGVSNAMARHGKLWPNLGCPVVAQLVDADARSMGKLAARMTGARGVLGLELVPLTHEVEVAARMVRSAVQESDLPVWVKLPLAEAVVWAEPLVEMGANGLVVGQPPRGQLGSDATGLVNGGIYGPLAFALMLPALRALARLQLPAALIACGGIHTVAQMEQALAAGASAVQIDSAVWVEPALPNWLAAAWEATRDGGGRETPAG
jgi:dihydroorotate dehydrogenase (NAD+) catalytic subunit